MIARFLVGTWTIAIVIALSACYDVPRPQCGFACGPGNVCPNGYVCNNFGDNRCHPAGIDFAECDDAPDPGVEDPRPRVITSSVEESSTIDPSLIFIDVQLTRPVSGLDMRTFRLVRDDGFEVPADRFAEDIDTTVSMELEMFALEVGRSYTLSLDGNIFDAAGYRLIPYHYTFTVVPDQPPQISERYPAALQTDVPVGISCYVELNEEVTGLDPSDMELRRGASVIAASVTSGIGFNGLMMNPLKQLIANTQYTVVMLAGFSDTVGNVFPETSWTFTTGDDDVSPFIVSSPSNAATQVAVDRTITIEFDEGVGPINPTTIRLEALVGGVLVDAELTYDPVDFIAYLNPNLQLSPNTSYRVRISTEIEDAFGNAISSPSIGFQTSPDTVAPGVSSTTPEAESTGASRTGAISMVFDEAVLAPGQTDISVSANSFLLAGTASAVGARTWQFVPSATLPANTAIRVEVFVLDVYGNSAFYSYEFTTGP